MAGLYLHVPFCKSKCPYCDFYSLRGNEATYNRYMAAMLRAILSFPGELIADTIYFGGGTPVLLGADRLLTLLHSVQNRFGVGQAEITIEANPCSVDESFLLKLAKGGFTRISFGVQSMNDETLRVLGRGHTAERAAEMILAAGRAGFKHISADIMLAVPSQSIDEIKSSIDILAALPVDHLSAYLLKIEEGTFFAKRYTEPDENFAADCYLAMVDRCKKHGFFQYEISNFSKNESAKSIHNLKYWQCEEYLGIGPAAHSFYNGNRFYFPRNLIEFDDADDPWKITVNDSTGGDEDERLMLGLRLAKGILFEDFSPEFCNRLKHKAPPLIKASLLTMNNRGIALTTQGFLVSNSIITALI